METRNKSTEKAGPDQPPSSSNGLERRSLWEQAAELPFEPHRIRMDPTGRYHEVMDREFPFVVRLFHFRHKDYTPGWTWHEIGLRYFCRWTESRACEWVSNKSSFSPATLAFKWLFIKLFNEHTQKLANSDLAAVAWLELVLINVGRWILEDRYQELLPEQPDSDVLQLWHIVHECVGRSQEFVHQIGKVPNYDSVRHRFKNMFGVSPTQLLFRLRMQKATSLLLETPMSIKEIADQLGYERQHDFAKAFRKYAGRSPTGWRTEPFPRDRSFSSK